MTSSASLVNHKLPNGLTVVIIPRPSVQVVTVDMWVGTGSADEIPEINGVSHFLEHMLFKGTKHYGVGDIDRIIEGVGGVINAGTSHDFTHYYVTAASAEFSTALKIIAEVIQHSTLDSRELDRERQVILEEYRRKQDDPYGFLWERVHEQMYREGPYKAPVLGIPESLQATTRERMLDYYHRTYCADNMTLLVVGNVDASDAIPQVEASFAGFNRRHRPLLSPDAYTTVFAAGSETAYKKEVNETYFVMALPAPGLEEKDCWYALDVLQYVLGGGRASLLYQEIKEKRRLATTIGAGYPTSKYPSMFYITATCRQEKRRALEQAIWEQLDRVAQNPPDSATLARAKRLLVNSHAFSLETTNGQSSMVGYYHTVTGSSRFEQGYAEGISGVNASEVQTQAQRWLKKDTANQIWLEPL